MSARKAVAMVAMLAMALLVTGRLRGQQGQPAEHKHDHMAGMDMGPAKHAEHDAVPAMGPGRHHMGPHMKLTAPRQQTPEDSERADAIAKTLRAAIEKYKDYRMAIANGYQPFLPNLPLPEYHFTNYKNGFLEAFTFDPARPTSDRKSVV